MTKKLTPEDLHLWKVNTRDVKILSQTVLPSEKPPVSPSPRRGLPEEKPSSPDFVPSSPLPSLDRKSLRHFTIEARLDMHGLTLEKGYRVLETFLKNAQEKGIKTILIITGKGSLRDDNTLRRQLPRWLEDTALRRFVTSLHHPAKLQDGGTGAFYVRVKRKDKGLSPSCA